jgi:hypothetical protein
MDTDSDRGEREHVAKQCMVAGCDAEARYWFDASEGFCESLLKTTSTPGIFFLCLDHQDELNAKDDNDGGYVHLRIDTGEIDWKEIAVYACHPDCAECRD